jgi:hypothetical protein
MASPYDEDFELLINCVALNMACAAVAAVAVNHIVTAGSRRQKT